MWRAELTAAMQQAGIRRLCVIAGEAGWVLHEAAAWQAALPGDWLTVSDSDDFLRRCVLCWAENFSMPFSMHATAFMPKRSPRWPGRYGPAAGCCY